MPRYVAPDRGVKETVIGGKKYQPDRGGIYNVESRSHGEAMKRETPTQQEIRSAASPVWNAVSMDGSESVADAVTKQQIYLEMGSDHGSRNHARYHKRKSLSDGAGIQRCADLN